MLSLSNALRIIRRETPRLGTEKIEIELASDRILAEDILADSDMPPFDRSQMDGFAVMSKDTKNAPVRLRLVGESKAGRGWNGRLSPGEAVRIMTGARLPLGADAVQKLELATESGNYVTIAEPVEKGRFVVKRGAETKAGTTCLRVGRHLTAFDLAIPAAFGKRKIKVYRRPEIVIIPTGSEIVPPASRPGRDQIRDSNSQMLAALCRKAGGNPHIMPIVSDELSEITSELKNAIKRFDVIITTGGVSVGKYDLTGKAFENAGANIYFDRVKLKPGKPVTFGKKGRVLFFGLPGNPVSAGVSFYLLVRPALRAMQGERYVSDSPIPALAGANLKAVRGRDTYLPVKAKFTAKGIIAEPLRWAGSSDFVSMAGANGLAIVPSGKTIAAGEPVSLINLTL